MRYLTVKRPKNEKQPTSAGILMTRGRDTLIEVLLVHPGGPYWRSKWDGYWQIPKGAPRQGEKLLAAAIREFEEELGYKPSGPFRELGEITQPAGKRVFGFTCAGNLDPATVTSATFQLEWPPRSGALKEFPEVDAVRWFKIQAAAAIMLPSQTLFLDRL
jgi:predicted NUDIX family NTP pyrophosphohydrolase